MATALSCFSTSMQKWSINRCGSSWLACIEPWPQPHRPPGKCWLLVRPNRPTSVPILTNALVAEWIPEDWRLLHTFVSFFVYCVVPHVHIINWLRNSTTLLIYRTMYLRNVLPYPCYAVWYTTAGGQSAFRDRTTHFILGDIQCVWSSMQASSSNELSKHKSIGIVSWRQNTIEACYL